jgi:hypothetical protein
MKIALLAVVLAVGGLCHTHVKCHTVTRTVCTQIISGYDTTGRPIYVQNCREVTEQKCETVCD